MENELFKSNVLSLIKAVTFYQLAVTSEETFEYSIRKLNYFGAKEGVDEFIAVLPDHHIAKNIYDELNGLSNSEFMKVKTVVFIKMIIWEIKNNINDWKFIEEDEDVEKMAIQVANTDISNIEEFVKDNSNLLKENQNRYKYYFALLYDYIVGQKMAQVSNLLKTELKLFQEYNFHDIYKSYEDEFFYQNAEDERKEYLDLVKDKINDIK